jgi:hypothetical protein
MVNTSGKKSRVRILITFVAVLCTALFIGRTIVFLYAAVTGNQVVIIIFVLFEALPCYGKSKLCSYFLLNIANLRRLSTVVLLASV